MTAPTSARQSRAQILLRALGAVLTLLCAVPLVLFAAMAVQSRFAGSFDPHGYQLIFGTLIAIALCVPTALLLPLAFPAGRRVKPLLISVGAFILLAIALFAMLATA